MQAYVFRGHSGTYAVSADAGGARLPAMLGPWVRWKEVAIDDAGFGRISLAADEVGALRRTGYVLLPKGLVIDDA